MVGAGLRRPAGRRIIPLSANGADRPMDARLTYDPRNGVLAGDVAGKAFRVRTLHDPASAAEWSQVARAQRQRHQTRHGVGNSLAVAESARLEIYDYPGDYAQRFDGGSDVKGEKNKPRLPGHRGASVFVPASGGGFHIHGLPASTDRRAIVVVEQWDALFRALKSARQVSIFVAL
jgi:hypothetical protein